MLEQRMGRIAALIFSLACLIAVLAAAQTSSQPQPPAATQQNSPTSDAKHMQDVNRHGDMAMGFSHTKATHHFGLTPSGGFVDVQANQADDTLSRDQIRHHLRMIADSFAAGDFSAPMMTHSRALPGMPTMQRLKSEITYKYVETERGARVQISTANAQALKAVHEFLRFQIRDHQTGDPDAVEKR